MRLGLPRASGDAVILAHGIGGRQDLPFAAALWGAAVTLVVSFVLLARCGRRGSGGCCD